MSYILDALKKSQAEKDPAARHSLTSEHKDRRRYRYLLTLIVLALLGNAVVLAYIFAPGPWQKAALISPAPEGAAPPADAAKSPELAVTEPQPPVAAAREAAALQAAARSAAAQSAAATSASPSPEPPPAPRPVQPQPKPVPAAPIRATPATLPATLRSRFPSLDFSTHLYASDPELRAVVVNGQRLQEGDRLRDLTVEEITENGVVFAFENYLVTVNVLDEWQ